MTYILALVAAFLFGVLVGWIAREAAGIDRARRFLHSERGRRFLDNLGPPKDDEGDRP